MIHKIFGRKNKNIKITAVGNRRCSLKEGKKEREWIMVNPLAGAITSLLYTETLLKIGLPFLLKGKTIGYHGNCRKKKSPRKVDQNQQMRARRIYLRIFMHIRMTKAEGEERRHTETHTNEFNDRGPTWIMVHVFHFFFFSLALPRVCLYVGIVQTKFATFSGLNGL